MLMRESEGVAIEAAKKEAAKKGTAVSRDSNLALSIKDSSIGGPSAGLVMALQAYEMLTRDDLTKKRYQIAGTGTISADGKVGAVGGIVQKMIAASRAGAQLFLVPAGDAKDAEKWAHKLDPNLHVLPVQSLSDAIEQLQKIKVNSQS